MSNKVGILARNFGPSQLAFNVIRSVNQAAEEGVWAPFLFQVENKPLCLTTLTSVMHISEAFAFDGILIATDFTTAQYSLGFIRSRRLFFVQDLEYLRIFPRSYRQFQGVYGSPTLELLARSQSHERALAVWNRPVRVVGEFDLKVILNA